MEPDAKDQRFSLRKHRLGRKDFERAFSQGGRARGALLDVIVVENGLPYSRLGLSVGKRVSKHAVRRNRVRRLFREAFRLSRAELPAGVDVVMIAAAKGTAPTLAALRAELAVLCKRARARVRGRRANEPANETPSSLPREA